MNLGGGSLIPPGSHLMALALMLIALGVAKDGGLWGLQASFSET